jgi:rod shape determining protein RodA
MNRKMFSNFNWIYFSVILLISILGVVIIYSANHGRPEEFFRSLYIKQIFRICLGLVVMLFAIFVDYRFWGRNAYFIYAVIIIFLVWTLFFGNIASGARRWIRVGPLILQVSEFAKFALIIVLAQYYGMKRHDGKYKLVNLIIPAIYTGIICLLISLQPDLGTAMIILFVFGIFVLASEMYTTTLIKLFFVGLVSIPMLWFILKDYQKTRVLTLFNPELDPLGAGYHAIQSKIAIGSGGFGGQGLFAGSQSRLNFLPEKHTDFIFSVFAEETGFLGVTVLLILYIYIILKGLNIAYKAADRFGLFLALGIIGSIAFYIIVNIGMTIGLFPITGIPLPLLSYGGSSLISTYFAFGLLLNIEMRREVR